MHRIHIGDVEVVSLLDLQFRFEAARIWPAAGAGLDAYRDRLDGDGRVLIDVLCFLLRDDGHTVLVDTGWGPASDELLREALASEGASAAGAEGRLLEELAAAGVTPAEVDTVVLTHLHGDHTGWNIDRATGEPVFANARYLVGRADWDACDTASPASASFVRDMKPLQLSGHLELFDGERALTPSITAVDISGHTPGHTGVAVASRGERAFFTGDAFFTTIDVEQPDWASIWDEDVDAARQRRRELLERLAADGSLVCPAHLPSPGFGHILRGASGYVWEAVVS